MRVSKRNTTKGQSTVEYAVLAAVVIGALLFMQIYIKRGAMGKLRDATDNIGEQFTPLATTNAFQTTFNSTRNDVLTTAGKATSVITGSEQQKRSGKEDVTQNLDVEKLFKP